MNGLIIATNISEYYGVGNLNCFAEYLENHKLGNDINNFIENYVDEDSQQIKFSPYSIYDAKDIRDKIDKYFEPCKLIAYCDIDENIDDCEFEFIGYDVCGNDYYTSPIGLNYLSMSLDEAEFTDDIAFFENIDNSIRYEYNEKRNDCGLFDDIAVADEIAEYCNWLAEEYDDMFFEVNDFKTVKIYLAK